MQLTRRQRQVVALLADGMSCPQVAGKLKISLATVRAHVRDIAARLPGNLPALRRVREHADELLEAA